MDYKDIRDKFIELSGRYDLVKSDGQDNGADFFINAGQRMLDRRAGIIKIEARNFSTLRSGDVYVATAGLLAVKEAWVISSEARQRLERVPIAGIREYYDSLDPTLSSSMPAYYAPTILRPYPDTITPTALAAYDGSGDVIASEDPDSQHFSYNGILVMPPSDTDYTIEIWGKFCSPELSAVKDGDDWEQTRSAWSVNDPDILITAALYKLEGFYRNREGARDFLELLDTDLVDLDKIRVDEECAEVTQMEG